MVRRHVGQGGEEGRLAPCASAFSTIGQKGREVANPEGVDEKVARQPPPPDGRRKGQGRRGGAVREQWGFWRAHQQFGGQRGQEEEDTVLKG